MPPPMTASTQEKGVQQIPPHIVPPATIDVSPITLNLDGARSASLAAKAVPYPDDLAGDIIKLSNQRLS